VPFDHGPYLGSSAMEQDALVRVREFDDGADLVGGPPLDLAQP
jgi:hypothetical protein